ncbi:MAG TPA: LysR substrate-binding domain-containing protein [Microvirga sp.]|jgi:DNA-binding transcriptional LysR family regulator|nr:LysR substrate-binding domain-containing protein [Microvirga sp.]
MRANELAELSAFVAVAEARSFRRAAARLNLTPSTLSHSLRSLEERLGVRLLNRTTRTVSPTDAGHALLKQIAPAFASIETAVEAVNAFRLKPHGTIRLNVPHLAATMVLAPVLRRFALDYPDVTLEVAANDAFIDIVAEGFDAGIRLGESLDQDMTAVRVSPDFRTAIVGSPDYFTRHPVPETPHDLQTQPCIGYRAANGTLYRWEFEKDGKPLTVQVSGPLVIDAPTLMISAALDGVGLAYATESVVADHLASGRLIRVLEDWSPSFPGFYLYYPGRRQTSAALRVLAEMLRL